MDGDSREVLSSPENEQFARTWSYSIYRKIILAVIFLLALGTAAGAAEIVYTVRPGDSLWLIAQRFNTTVDQLMALNGLTSTTIYVDQKLKVNSGGDSGGFAEHTEYYVMQGDTLYLISLRFGTTVAAIMEANNLNSTMILVGQRLLIPAGSNIVYTAEPGDTLFLIARRFGTTVEVLWEMNGLTSEMIYPGQQLKIPAGAAESPAPPVPQPPPMPEPPGPGIILYRVVSGDTLSGVAYRYKTTIRAIEATNNLHSQILMIGQPLYIPVGRTSPVHVEGPSGEARPGFGEFLDWEAARWIYNPGAIAVVRDLFTGRTFSIRHMGGSNHADSEPVTKNDTREMKSIWGGWSWAKRPVILDVYGRKLAASMAGQPHGVEQIDDNGVAGHFDLYFWNSTRHKDNTIVPEHQENILRAAGYR